MEQKNIKNSKNVENSVKLRAYFRSLPIEQSQEKAREMIEACKVPKSTFNNWRAGLSRIPELAKDKINEVAGYALL